MLEIDDIPFFSSLSQESKDHLKNIAPLKHYVQGSIIVRAGDVGKHFQAIADGAVWVQTSNTKKNINSRGVLLGPGQVFGEMSLFSGAPIANTLVATKDTAAYCIDGAEFLALLEREPSLHRSLTKMLIERLRRQSRVETNSPSLIVISHRHQSDNCHEFVEVLTKAILHYAGATEVYRKERSDKGDFENPAFPSRLVRWRESAPGDQFLLIKVRPQDLNDLQDVMEPKDVVLQISDVTETSDDTELIRINSGVADFARVFIGIPPAGGQDPWAYRVSIDEIHYAQRFENRWEPVSNPTISRIARFATYKEVGIAMSSGAARGFAHLGVLEVLDGAGIPVDVMCGSSMGGIIALTLAREGNVSKTIARVRKQLGSNKKIRDPALFPRGSIFRGSKIENAAKATFGDCTFSDLTLPVSVVCADIAAGERVIIDRGTVTPAVLATSSIPGFFPPISVGSRLLVDGGVVSWVPVDVLDHRRCGIRIAINVLPLSQYSESDITSSVKQLGERLRRPLGLKAVLSASWELLGSWGSTSETGAAEVVITPSIPSRAGYDFDRFDELVQCGREAAEARIESISELLDQILGA